jgi:hypothetical protein
MFQYLRPLRHLRQIKSFLGPAVAGMVDFVNNSFWMLKSPLALFFSTRGSVQKLFFYIHEE